MLEKFKNKQLDAQSMKQVKGGHETGHYYSCRLENGGYYDLPVGFLDDLSETIDKFNEDHNLAIVGCETTPWN